MIDRITARRWTYWGIFTLVAILALFIRLLPLGLGAGRLPGPDLLLALTMAWVVRRPDYVPVFLLAVLFFLADILLLNAPGLWALSVVLGAEFLRRREMGLREQPFLVEYGTVAGTLFMMLLGQRLLMGLFMVDQISLGRAILAMLATIAAYPVMALVTVYVFGIRKLQPGADEISGHYA